ncbi:hypothetical protein R3P38DRAFT_2888315 [Favolaschia claudopus]|uniref:F-box domain-containing protein n=1 Tax=Favolaschia claudopus TaxID=2862362 RepID=A0AAW0CPJ2_9AGAR
MNQADQTPVGLTLPAEILLDIVSYFHNRVLPYEPQALPAPDTHTTRVQVLRSLSQVCQYYRRVFLRLSWEYLEILDAPENSSNPFPNRLLRRMTGIVKTPSVPRCIRTAVVSLKLPSNSNQMHWDVITVFVRLLVAASKLSCLHIVDVSGAQASVLADILASHSFPGITRLAVPCALARSLSAFPNVLSLTVTDKAVADYYAIAFLKASGRYCKRLEEISHLSSTPPAVKCFVKVHPDIEALSFHDDLTPNTFKLLRELKSLKSIQFPHRHSGTLGSVAVCAEVKSCFLRSESGNSTVRVEYPSGDDVGDDAAVTVILDQGNPY